MKCKVCGNTLKKESKPKFNVDNLLRSLNEKGDIKINQITIDNVFTHCFATYIELRVLIRIF